MNHAPVQSSGCTWGADGSLSCGTATTSYGRAADWSVTETFFASPPTAAAPKSGDDVKKALESTFKSIKPLKPQ